MGPNILLVEFDSIIALDIKHILRQYGYSNLSYMRNAEEALEYCWRNTPDLILAEDFTCTNKEDEHNAILSLNIPLIVLADKDDPCKKAENADCNCMYINKPYQNSELINCVNCLLRKK